MVSLASTLQQEAALICYAVGFAITPPLVLVPVGAFVATLVPISIDREHRR